MASEQYAVKQKTILLVDDDADCRSMIREGIGELAKDCVGRELADGQEVLDYLYRRGRYADAPPADLIFLDIAMPGPSGQTVLKQIKSDPALRGIPVVVLTGLPEGTETDQALASGADSCILKPTDPIEFFQSVRAAALLWLGPSG